MANDMAKQVAAWAAKTHGAGVQVSAPYGDVDVHVPGLQLFLLSAPPRYLPSLIVVADGQMPPLERADAMHAIVARVKDPIALARLAQLSIGGGGQVVVDLANDLKGIPPDHARMAAGPSMTGRILSYWFVGAGMDHTLKFARLNLDTLELVVSDPVSMTRDAMDPFERKRLEFAEGSGATFPEIVDAIVTLCKDPRAAALLDDTLQHHADPHGRAAAATGLARCHDAASMGLLTAALRDQSPVVRKAAAETLGALGDAKARPALKEARDAEQDMDAKGAMMRAVSKLPE